MTINNLEIIIKKPLSLLYLIKAQVFSIYKLMEIVIANREKHLIFGVFQVIITSLKSFNNKQELLIIGLVPNLYRNHFFKKKNY